MNRNRNPDIKGEIEAHNNFCDKYVGFAVIFGLIRSLDTNDTMLKHLVIDQCPLCACANDGMYLISPLPNDVHNLLDKVVTSLVNELWSGPFKNLLKFIIFISYAKKL